MGDEREFKNLPEGWKLSKVKDLFVDGRGRIISEEEIKNKEGIYPVYSSQTSNNGELGKINTYDFEGEFITWTTDGANAGTVFYRNGKFNCTNVCGILKPRNENINVKFFSYLLSTIAKNYVSYIGNPKLMNSTFRDIKIIHPNNYYEQRKIAEILETVDNAIEKTDKIIEKYKRIKQGLMQDLLTKGIDEKGNIRSEKMHKFKDSPLGRIPEEWEVVRLGEILKFLKGKTPRKLYDYEEEGMTIYLTPEYLRKNKCDVAFCKKEETLLANEDIIILWDGSNAGEVFWAEKGAVASTMAKIDITSSDFPIYKKFLYYYLKSNEFVFKYQVKGSGIPHFEKDILNTLNSVFPPLSEQKRIAEILSQIDQAIEKEEKYKQKLERLKKGLMEDLLTGKVRVNKLLEGENHGMA